MSFLHFITRTLPYSDEILLKRSPYAIGLSFGIGPAHTSGMSNAVIASIMQELREKYGCLLMAQWEIGDCIASPHFVVRTHREKNSNGTTKYLDTYEVFAQIKDTGIIPQGASIILVAHPDHWARCAAVARSLGFIPLVPPDIMTIPFDPLSTQPWTRDAIKFFPREIAAWGLYTLKGWTSTSLFSYIWKIILAGASSIIIPLLFIWSMFGYGLLLFYIIWLFLR